MFNLNNFLLELDFYILSVNILNQGAFPNLQDSKH